MLGAPAVASDILTTETYNGEGAGVAETHHHDGLFAVCVGQALQQLGREPAEAVVRINKHLKPLRMHYGKSDKN